MKLSEWIKHFKAIFKEIDKSFEKSCKEKHTIVSRRGGIRLDVPAYLECCKENGEKTIFEIGREQVKDIKKVYIP